MKKSLQGNMLMSNNSPDKRKKDLRFVVTKFMQKGFNSLTEEELAVTLINPNFNSMFQKTTGNWITKFSGVNWVTKYQVKTIEKLRAFNFDMNFITSGVKKYLIKDYKR